MSKKLRIIFALVSVLSGSAAFFLYSSVNEPPARAEFRKGWITVDLNELNHIQKVSQKVLRPLDLEVVRVENGIAVVKVDDYEMSQLSQHSHEQFQKCGGFISHQSEADALQTIENFARADANAVMVEYSINNAATVQSLMSGMQASNIVGTITTLSNFNTRYHLSQTGLQSANWIKDRWTALAQGRSDVTVEFINHPTTVTPQPSVVLTIQGTAQPDEIIVLGAHQDSTRSGCISTSTCQTLRAPGADDDASGIASLTEVIRVALAGNYRPAKTVKFMAYAAEEVGLRGSNAIATDFRNRNVNVIGVLQLDMTNYKGSTTTDIAIFTDFTNAPQNQFLRDLIAAYLPTLTVTNSQCGYGCSDHASWHNKSYPASFPFESPFNVSNSNIHKETDTLAASDATGNHSLKFTKLAGAYMAELAKGNIVTAPTGRKRFDFDGDGKADVSVFRPSNGGWYRVNSANNTPVASSFGQQGDLITPADFDGDGKTDISVLRNGVWYRINSSDNQFASTGFGAAGDIPVPADFDGDGKDDVSVFRPSNATWYRINSSNNQAVAQQWGANGDLPQIADVDGDGKADFAVFRPSNGGWYSLLSSNNSISASSFGQQGDVPTPADYDGDGKTDISVFRPATGSWYRINSANGQISGTQFGASEDKAVPADFDGDGKADIAVFRPSNGTWYLNRSTQGFSGQAFGTSEDVPTPAAFGR